MNLYEISSEYKSALESLDIDHETGEITGGESFDILMSKAESFELKAENVALYIKDIDALASSIKTEEKTLKERRTALEGKLDWLKRYMTATFTNAGLNKLETAKCRVSFRRTTSVRIDDENEIPTEYFNEKILLEPSKSRIKDAITGGILVPGASLVTNNNIQIK